MFVRRNHRGELPTIPPGRLRGSGSARFTLLLVARDGAFSACLLVAVDDLDLDPPGFKHLQVRCEFKTSPDGRRRKLFTDLGSRTLEEPVKASSSSLVQAPPRD